MPTTFSEEWRSDNHPSAIFAIGRRGIDLVNWWYLGFGEGAWASFTVPNGDGRLLVYDGTTAASLADPRGLWLDNGLPGDPTDDVLFRHDIFFAPEHAYVKFLPSTLEIWPTAGVTINHVYLFDQEIDVSGGYPVAIPAAFLKGPQAPGTGGVYPGLACDSTPPFTVLAGRPALIFAIDTIGAPLGSVGVAWKLVINGISDGCAPVGGGGGFYQLG